MRNSGEDNLRLGRTPGTSRVLRSSGAIEDLRVVVCAAATGATSATISFATGAAVVAAATVFSTVVETTGDAVETAAIAGCIAPESLADELSGTLMAEEEDSMIRAATGAVVAAVMVATGSVANVEKSAGCLGAAANRVLDALGAWLETVAGCAPAKGAETRN